MNYREMVRRVFASETTVECPTNIPPAILNAYLVIAILVSATWASAEIVGLWWFAAIATILVVTFLTRPQLELPEAGPPARLLPVDFLTTAIVWAPVVIYLAQTWRQEFPYLGDQDVHLGLSLEAFRFWSWRWVAAALAIVAMTRRPSGRRIAPFLVLAILVILGVSENELHSFSSRYPGALHFLTVPIHAVARLFAWPSYLNVPRLGNALAIPVWLLVLRPWLLRRRPTGPILLVAFFLFWQKDFVYYFTSAYLEAWAVVLILIAAEHVLIYRRAAAWRVLMLLGAAALVKDQAAFAFPPFVLVLFPWKGSFRDWVRTGWIALVTSAPFLVYYRLRLAAQVWRSVEIVSRAEITDPARAHVFAQRLTMQFDTALPLLVTLIVATIVYSIAATRYRTAMAACLLVFASNMGLFYIDRIQQFWTGYFRTEMIPFAVVALALVPLGEYAFRSRGGAVIALAVILGSNALPLASQIELTTRSDVARSFLEHTEAPIYYPIRFGIESGAAAGIIRPYDRIRILDNGKNFWRFFYIGPFDDQYVDLSKQYTMWSENFHRLVVKRCNCRPGEVTLAVFVYFTNQGSMDAVRQQTEAESALCEAEIIRTCRSVATIDFHERRIGLIAR